MYYIVYKTTNLINNKFYVGIHKQKEKEFDGYYGSGLLLNRAIEKYGIDNFKRETLFECNSWDECRKIEKEIVNTELCINEMCYNISIGGSGGNTICGYTTEKKKEIAEKRNNTRIKNGTNAIPLEKLPIYQENMRKIRIQPDNKGRVHTDQSRKNMAEANHMRNSKFITNGIDNKILYEGEIMPEGFYYGRTLSEENKFKGHSSDTLKNMSEKRKNSQYYNNGIINKLFFKDEIIPDGWTHGMLPRKKNTPKRWYTNGIDSILLISSDSIPDGYYLGRKIKIANTEIKKD